MSTCVCVTVELRLAFVIRTVVSATGLVTDVSIRFEGPKNIIFCALMTRVERWCENRVVIIYSLIRKPVFVAT